MTGKFKITILSVNSYTHSLNSYNRPPWTTGCLIPASFICGIAAGVTIARGTNKTKKTAQVEDRLRKALAAGHKERNDAANGVYARRAGLVGMLPMNIPEGDDDYAGGDVEGKAKGSLSTEGETKKGDGSAGQNLNGHTPHHSDL